MTTTTKTELAARVEDLERELKDAQETRSRAIDEAIGLRKRVEQLTAERDALKQATPTAEEFALVAANRDDMKACVQDALHWLREVRTRFCIHERTAGAIILVEMMLAEAVTDDIPF